MSAHLQTAQAQTYRCRADVIVTDLQNELVLLDPNNVEMYSLGPVGRAIWLSLPATPQTAAGQVRLSFDISAEEALRDAQALLEDLQLAGLVEQREG